MEVFVRIKTKREEKIMKKLSQFLKSHILGMFEAVSLKFGTWTTDSGGCVHSKKSSCFIKAAQSSGCVKIAFLSSSQYSHSVACRLLGPHNILPCVLINLG